MAMTALDIARVTRSWGGHDGEALYIAHRAPLTQMATPQAPTMLIGNKFTTAGEAQAAVQSGLPGKVINWREEDLPGDIESFVGSILI